MKKVEFMNVEPFDMSEGQESNCYYSINMDENYEENHEEPAFEKVEDLAGCYDIDGTCGLF